MPSSISFDEEDTDGIWRVKPDADPPAPGSHGTGGSPGNDDGDGDDADPPRRTLGQRLTALWRATRHLALRFKPNPPPNRNHKRSR